MALDLVCRAVFCGGKCHQDAHLGLSRVEGKGFLAHPALAPATQSPAKS